MYNPSQHIPLSKPLGPAAFPLDGKFQFYTNGQNGVYAYRPYQSVAEVLAEFPLGSPFRAGNFEILVNSGGTLSGDGSVITGGVNSIYWWGNGVADEDLVLKVLGQASAVTLDFIAYTQAQLVADGFGGWKLPFTPDNSISWPVSIENRYNYGSGAKFKNIGVTYEDGFLFGFEDPTLGTQAIKVYYAVNSDLPTSVPVFTLQPQASITVLQGEDLIIPTAATGALSFQWHFNGVAISGATSDTLTVTNFNATNEGVYRVDATNADGTTSSNNATVSNDTGVIIYNNSNLRIAGSSVDSGRDVNFDDGVISGTIAVGGQGRFLKSAAVLLLTQEGNDNLLLIDYYTATKLFTPIYGFAGNNYARPSVWPVEMAIFNLKAATGEVFVNNNCSSVIKGNDNGAGDFNIFSRNSYSKSPITAGDYFGVTFPLNTKLIVTRYNSSGVMEDMTEYSNTASPMQTVNILSLSATKGYSAVVTDI